jgi:hypothetical protein
MMPGGLETTTKPPWSPAAGEPRAEEPGDSRRWIWVLGSLALAVVLFGAAAEWWISNIHSQGTPAVLERALAGNAKLGTPESFFVAALGRPASTRLGGLSGLDTVLFAACHGSTARRYQLQVSFADGRAAAIRYTPCETAQAATSRFSQARRFLPDDASAHATSFTTTLGTPAYRVQSPSLASSMGSTWFQDCEGLPVTPGTAAFALTAAGGWELTVGTCPG